MLLPFTAIIWLSESCADCKVFLYFTEGFFIEVFYSPKYQKVLMINAFEKPIGLDPYLDKISLADLDRVIGHLVQQFNCGVNGLYILR